MQIAAAVLAGGFVFFAGFCLGLYPPAKTKLAIGRVRSQAEKDNFFENFLSYDGQVQP